jgi:7-carboxy-7-deazaguanine synthase
MKNKNLVISELFYSIQGEGQTMGIPAVFLRLAGCNILCKGKGWICDSIEVWKKGTKTPFEEVFPSDLIWRLDEGAHLVITGGEPLLHQKKIIQFLDWFKQEYGWIPIVEIETNGTIVPDSNLIKLITYWNCSPKLSSSGETRKRRYNEIALKTIQAQKNSIFKFVISEEMDVLEMLNEFPSLNMEQVVLMPAGDSQKLLNNTRPMVLEQCIKLGLRYCDRLHIVGWNKKTGV